MDLPNKPFHFLGVGELKDAREQVVRELYAAQVELSQVKIQYMWAYGQAYRASTSQHVSGRIQEAEIAAAGIKEDEIELMGRIDSLSTIRDYLASLSD